MPTRAEVLSNGTVRGEKALGVSGRLEPVWSVNQALSSTFALLSGVGEERNYAGLMTAAVAYAAGARAYRMVSCKD
jgi:hypothetical protein